MQAEEFDLIDLANAEKYNHPIDCSNRDSEMLKDLLKSLLEIRIVENKIALHKKLGDIIGPVHLAAGQEAIAVGVSSSLTNSDRVFGAHRSHSHLLALGSDIKKLFAEIIGKVTGHSKGMGGSMHLQDTKVGFYGSVPIVAGTIPLAVGAGLAAKMQSSKSIAVSYFGDGAVEEGVFHESLNLSRILKCPTLFVCENNLFSSHMHISKRQPYGSIARFAYCNDIDFRVIDGNNILDCVDKSSELINIARNECKPVFLEAITFRIFGHVDWREDIDVGINRSEKDIKLWKLRDPIKRFIEGLLNEKIIDYEYLDSIEKEIKQRVDILWEQASKEPYPDLDESDSYLYSE